MIKGLIYKTLVGFREFTHPNGMERTINGIKCRYTARYAKGVPAQIEIPMLLSILESAKSAKVVLELGGHIGIWTELIANSMPQDGRIFVFEPNPNTYVTLQKQAAVSLSKHKITTINEAVGEKNGSLKFEMFPDQMRSFEKSAKSKLMVSGQPAEAGCVLIDVPVKSVDGFCKEQNISPDVIKVDIEGAELYALKGMKDILAAGKAKLFIEMHQFAWNEFGYTGQDFLNFTNSLTNYVLKDHTGRRITEVDADFLDNLKLGYVQLLPVSKQ